MLTLGVVLVGLVVQFTYPTLYDCGNRCDGMYCFDRTQEECVWVPCPQLPDTALATVRLYGHQRWAPGWFTFIRERAVPPNAPGTVDTLEVPEEHAVEGSLVVSVVSRSGAETCYSNIINVYNGDDDTRTDVGPQAVSESALFDVTGRRVSMSIDKLPAGVYYLRTMIGSRTVSSRPVIVR